jgi:hypothetical protein
MGGYPSGDETPRVNIHYDEDEHSFESSGMDREKVDGPGYRYFNRVSAYH